MFNLNVDSYNLEELKNLFNINPSGLINSVSMHEILEERYQKLLSSLNNNSQMNSIEKKKSNEFLFQAKVKLENLLTPQISNTTYQDSKKVDSLPWNVSGNSSNPNTKKLTKLISVDSKFRDNSDEINTNNFQVSFNNKLNKVESMEIVEFSAPTSIKMISDSLMNNFFHIQFHSADNNSSPLIKITMRDCYRIERNILNTNDNKIFISNLNKIIENSLNDYGNLLEFQFESETDEFSSSGLIEFENMHNRTLTLNHSNNGSTNYSRATLHFNFDSNGNEDSINNLQKKLGYMLGFRDTSVDIDLNNSIKLTCALDLISFKYAYLVVDDFQSNGETNIVAEDVYSVPCAQNMKFGGNILAKINYKNDANYNVSNRIISTPRTYYGNVDISKLKIILVNEFGDLVDTQGAEWAFTLKFISSYN